MRQLFLFCFCLITTFLFSQTAFVSHQVLVMLQPHVSVADISATLDEFKDNSITIENAFCLSPQMNIWLLQLNVTEKEIDVIKKLQSNSSLVKLAQLNHYVESRFTPNDTDFGNQWALNNLGSSGGTNDADIDAPEAWDFGIHATTSGGDSIVIAIVDGGVDTLQSDLHLCRNYNEIPNNGNDDDHNGYTDDYWGWNSFTNSGQLPADFHGTHVSGIAGAIGNNNNGICGVDPDVQILGVHGNSNTESVVVAAYAYVFAARKLYNTTQGDSGKFIVSTNSSFGINNAHPSNYPIWAAMYDSMGSVGVLSAGATANSAVDVDVVSDMPTACPSNFLITVTNTTNADGLSPFGAWGDTTIDLGAPGTNIYSTLPGNSYGNLTGTSMASPHVAGAVAFLYSLPCPAFSIAALYNPTATALLVKNFILNGVDTTAVLWGKTVSDGRLNLYNSSLMLMQYYGCPLGMDETENHFSFSVYPNPASQNIHVICNAALVNTKTNIEIINVLGQKIFSQSLAQANTQFNIAAIPTGMYFLLLKDANGKLLGEQKLVKE